MDQPHTDPIEIEFRMHGSERQLEASAAQTKVIDIDRPRPALNPLERVAARERSILKRPLLRSKQLNLDGAPGPHDKAVVRNRIYVNQQAIGLNVAVPVGQACI